VSGHNVNSISVVRFRVSVTKKNKGSRPDSEQGIKSQSFFAKITNNL
jgi:hypothetical protein